MPRHEEFDDLLIGGDSVATDSDLDSKADQSEVDSLSSTVDSKADQSEVDAKADQDGGGTATLDNYSNVNTDQLNSGGPITDGDGIERQIWVIAAGASDPAGAGPDDLIFEEES